MRKTILANQYYTAGYSKEENVIYIDHVEPWQGSRRSENVFTYSVKDMDQKKIDKVVEIMNLTLGIVNEHSSEIKEYYLS